MGEEAAHRGSLDTSKRSGRRRSDEEDALTLAVVLGPTQKTKASSIPSYGGCARAAGRRRRSRRTSPRRQRRREAVFQAGGDPDELLSMALARGEVTSPGRRLRAGERRKWTRVGSRACYTTI